MFLRSTRGEENPLTTGVNKLCPTAPAARPGICQFPRNKIKIKNEVIIKYAKNKTPDDEVVEYKGHFCSECSIPPPGGVRGWVRGYEGVGLWEAGPGYACCEDYDWESLRVCLGFCFFFLISLIRNSTKRLNVAAFSDKQNSN